MDYLLQYSCLENPMDRGAWWAIVHGVAELDMAEHTQVTITYYKESSSLNRQFIPQKVKPHIQILIQTYELQT